MEKTLTLTIGIPAWNEEQTLPLLLADLLSQKLGSRIVLDKIIVASDGSIDHTADISSKFEGVTVIDGETNKGKAFRLNEIISMTESDLLVTIDADTRIKDRRFLKKLVAPLVSAQADMSSAQLHELTPQGFFERSLWVSMQLKRRLFCKFNKGSNLYTCHGPARAFTKDLYKQIDFPRNEGDDMYSYLACKSLKKEFMFSADAKIFYKLPTNIKDHLKQSLRYSGAIKYYKEIFGPEFVTKEMKIPKSLYFKTLMDCFDLVIRYPIHTAAYLYIFALSQFKSLFIIDPSLTWQVTSTKVTS